MQSAVTVFRVYTSCATREHYLRVFNKIQSTMRQLTGKEIRFKHLTPEGNLTAMIVDLEAAQILGAADSLARSNVVEHSGVPSENISALIPHFVRGCLVHVNRYVSSS